MGEPELSLEARRIILCRLFEIDRMTAVLQSAGVPREEREERIAALSEEWDRERERLMPS
jgi:hypothetical protein